MIQITPQMRVLVAVEAIDFRRGIDGLARVCRELLGADPFSGAVFVFRSKRGTAIKLLVYDGQGFWLCHKRLSQGRFRWWPSRADAAGESLRAPSCRCCCPAATRATRMRRRCGVRSPITG
jgi:transposase